MSSVIMRWDFKQTNPIFDHHYNDKLLSSIDRKRRVKAKVQKSKLDQARGYEDYEWCCMQLETGISAIKFNYTNERKRAVTIKLVKNRTAI